LLLGFPTNDYNIPFFIYFQASLSLPCDVVTWEEEEEETLTAPKTLTKVDMMVAEEKEEEQLGAGKKKDAFKKCSFL
jgi:hypothetical protein